MCKFSSKSGGVPFQISFFWGDLTRNDPATASALKAARWDHLNGILQTSLDEKNTNPFYRYITGACPGIRKRGGPKSFFFFAFQFFRGGGPAQKLAEKMIFSTKKVAKLFFFLFFLLFNF